MAGTIDVQASGSLEQRESRQSPSSLVAAPARQVRPRVSGLPLVAECEPAVESLAQAETR